MKWEDAIDRASKKVMNQARFAVAAKVWGKMNVALTVAMDATPVWSGNTIANYVWGVDYPSYEYAPLKDIGQRPRESREDERENFESLSRERLAIMQSEVFKDPFRIFYLGNNVEYDQGGGIMDLENGALTGRAYLMFTKARIAVKFL